MPDAFNSPPARNFPPLVRSRKRRSAMNLAVKTIFMLAVGLGFCGAGAGAEESAVLPKGGVWSLAGAMPEARQEAGIAALGDTVYIISGYGSDTVPSVLVQVYD